MTAAALVLAMLELVGSPAHGPLPARAARLAPAILREASRASLDPVLLAAIALVESDWRTDVHGAAGEIGAFQVKPDGLALYLCRGMVVSRIDDNARCAARLLEAARRRCGGSPGNWLGLYNGARHCGGSSYGSRVLAIRRRVR